MRERQTPVFFFAGRAAEPASIARPVEEAAEQRLYDDALNALDDLLACRGDDEAGELLSMWEGRLK